ncbi:MAG: amidase [Haloarculaceae archaeon]
MDELSGEELAELGEAFDVGLPDAQVKEVRAQVNDSVRALEALDSIPVELPTPDGAAGREWSDPGADAADGVCCRCHVPPTADASALLEGVEIGLKDIIAVAGVPMSCGSDVARGFVPGIDATVVRRLRAAGGTITAKLRLDEFAGSARGTTGSGGPIRNPHDPERTAGGSSGGSTVAVATGEVDLALGTDTGGSVRIPSALCGVIGLKPTYGLVPISGIVENTYTQDHVGPIADSLDLIARSLEAMAGKTTADPASLQAAGRDAYRVGGYADAVEEPPAPGSVELGVLTDGMDEEVADAVIERTEAALDGFADEGASVRRVSVDHYGDSSAIKNALSFTELAAHWRAGGAAYRRGGIDHDGDQATLAARMHGRNRDLGPFYRGKLLAGAYLIAHDDGRLYTRAQAARETLRAEFDAALGPVDAIAMPTVPGVAPRIEDVDDPGFTYGKNTRPANVARLPAITLPNGTVDGLPVGFQLVAPAFAERELLGLAAAVEPVLA